MIGDWYQDCSLCKQCKHAGDLAYVDVEWGMTVCVACNDRRGEATLAELPDWLPEWIRQGRLRSQSSDRARMAWLN